MFDVLDDINWFAVGLATLACVVLGGVWFAGIFGKQYALALGRDPTQKLQTTPLFFIGPAISSLVVTITTAILLKVLHITRVGDALMLGLIVGVGYLVATMFNVAINPNFPRPLSYAMLNAPYFVLCSLIISAILVAFS